MAAVGVYAILVFKNMHTSKRYAIPFDSLAFVLLRSCDLLTLSHISDAFVLACFVPETNSIKNQRIIGRGEGAREV